MIKHHKTSWKGFSFLFPVKRHFRCYQVRLLYFRPWISLLYKCYIPIFRYSLLNLLEEVIIPVLLSCMDFLLNLLQLNKIRKDEIVSSAVQWICYVKFKLTSLLLDTFSSEVKHRSTKSELECLDSKPLRELKYFICLSLMCHFFFFFIPFSFHSRWWLFFFSKTGRIYCSWEDPECIFTQSICCARLCHWKQLWSIEAK